MTSTDLDILQKQIEHARKHARAVFRGRQMLAGIMSGAPGISGYDVEFPEPDTMHVYHTMFSHRVGDPTTYRLSFGRSLKWVGVSHPWGLKPADIEVPKQRNDEEDDQEKVSSPALRLSS